MRRPFLLSLLALLIGSVLLSAQGGGGLRSGPKEGDFLPGPFDCYNFNGLHKGRFHCLVCRYALDPAVLVFVREPGEGKSAAVDALLKRLEEAVTVEFRKHELRAGVIFLSPDAQNSATNPDEQDPAKLVEEAKKRDALYARLADRAANFKGVDIAVFPPGGPKDYQINPKAEATVLFYWKLRVVMNRSFAPGTLREEDIDKMLARIKETLEPAKNKGKNKGDAGKKT
jgi:hypothetical protein